MITLVYMARKVQLPVSWQLLVNVHCMLVHLQILAQCFTVEGTQSLQCQSDTAGRNLQHPALPTCWHSECAYALSMYQLYIK